MYEDLTLPRLLKSLEQVLAEFPDKRTGENTQYDMADAGLGAFAVFFTQQASFLAQQRTLKTTKGWNNAERLLGLHSLPSDTLREIRNLLDPVSPAYLGPLHRQVFQALDRASVHQCPDHRFSP